MKSSRDLVMQKKLYFSRYCLSFSCVCVYIICGNVLSLFYVDVVMCYSATDNIHTVLYVIDM